VPCPARDAVPLLNYCVMFFVFLSNVAAALPSSMALVAAADAIATVDEVLSRALQVYVGSCLEAVHRESPRS
jgi:hypothetical protein